jgi:hypothetical protein
MESSAFVAQSCNRRLARLCSRGKAMKIIISDPVGPIPGGPPQYVESFDAFGACHATTRLLL